MAVHELFAYLTVRDAAAAIAFYSKAFGARERFRLTEPGGRVGHGELDLGPMKLMLAEEFPEYGLHAPKPGVPTTMTLHLHVDDADDTIRKAVAAGATLEMAPADQFYGERSGAVRDPFGHRWNIGHQIEDVSPEEMQRRYTRLMTPA
jgi:PhnB protein